MSHSRRAQKTSTRETQLNRLVVNKRSQSRGDVSLREPVKIGHYSVVKKDGGQRQLLDNETQLKLLALPSTSAADIHLDLTDGYEEKSKAYGASSDAGLAELLQWVLLHRDKFSLASESTLGTHLNTDFVTYRGALTRIMTSPYENQEDWLISASRFNGTIYFCLFETESKKEKERNRSQTLDQICFGGFRFEEYISRLAVNGQESTSSTEHNEFNVVFRSRLRSHSLAYGAEMDCIEVKPDTGYEGTYDLKDFVEIKTTASFKSQRQWDNFCKYKAIKWFTQCFLVATPKIICGYRDEDLVVRKIEPYTVRDLPKLGESYWSHQVCLNFLDDFLSFVKECVRGDDPSIVYQFYWKPRSDVICTVLRSDPQRYQVLPKWYIEAL